MGRQVPALLAVLALVPAVAQAEVALTHGPRLGDPRPTGFTVWVRADGETTVRLETRDAATWSWTLQDQRSTLPSKDHTVVLTATGLAPATRYDYRVLFDQLEVASYSTITMPPSSGGRFVAYHVSDLHNSGAALSGVLSDWQLRYEPAGIPAIVLHTGDWYTKRDTTGTDAAGRATGFYRILRETGDCLKQLPLVYIWDDHDYGGNNSAGSSYLPAVDDASVPTTVWDWTVRDMPRHASPSYAYTIVVAGIPFIITDQRSQKTGQFVAVPELDGTQPISDDATIWGAEQRRWILDQLANYRERALVFVISPTNPLDNLEDATIRTQARDGLGTFYKQERNLVVRRALELGYGQWRNFVWLVGDDHRNTVSRHGFAANPWPASASGKSPPQGLPLDSLLVMTDSGTHSSRAASSGLQLFPHQGSWFEDTDLDGDRFQRFSRWEIRSRRHGTSASARLSFLDAAVPAAGPVVGAGGEPAVFDFYSTPRHGVIDLSTPGRSPSRPCVVWTDSPVCRTGRGRPLRP